LKLNDAIFGLLLLALGGFVLFTVQGFPKIPGQPVGPALFPGLIAVGLCVSGLLLVIKGWLQRTRQPWLAWDDWVRSPRHIAALAVLLGCIVFYIAAAEKLGFLPVAWIILSALMATLKVPLGRALLIALIATLVIHFAFYKLLRVPLPWGVLKNFAW
jgi:putative tricarboxylic transport membrane protein